MSTDYQDIGYDAFMLKQADTGQTSKVYLSPLDSDSQFGDGSFPGMKLSSGPNIRTFGYPDNFDSSYPFILPYYIDSSERVVRATLSLFFQPYRAYETAASSGGSSSQTSSSGGGTTTSSGGGQTSSSTAQTSTATTTDTSGQTGHQHGSTMKGKSSFEAEDKDVKIRSLGTTDNEGYQKWQLVHDQGTTDYRISVGYTDTGHSHNVSITNPSHSHTVNDHTHTVGDHTHSVSIPAHTHGITYGIYSSGYPTTVSITIDGVDVTTALGGPWNPTAGDPNELDMDITNYTADTGSHTIQLTTTGQGRCIPMLIIKSVIGSKS